MPKPDPDSDAALEDAVHGVTAEMVDQANEALADEPERDPLPVHKDDLVALAIDRGIPSYEAWNLTVPELTERLES